MVVDSLKNTEPGYQIVRGLTITAKLSHGYHKNDHTSEMVKMFIAYWLGLQTRAAIVLEGELIGFNFLSASFTRALAFMSVLEYVDAHQVGKHSKDPKKES
ncbi:hypothetical protein BCON_0250g00150 [Botryotinia convoluta]|uniref:Uncharacterized protein n=1 Tax=Botryotinia convoluta TaxID=54673 RepID=A0A4Z1HLI7_9HELO|nr:hypothetical protein BCON_0250g00150 [Botryotinia convoluta]